METEITKQIHEKDMIGAEKTIHRKIFSKINDLIETKKLAISQEFSDKLSEKSK